MNKELKELVNKYKSDGTVVEPKKMTVERQREIVCKKIQNLNAEHQAECFVMLNCELAGPKRIEDYKRGYLKMLNKINSLQNKELFEARFHSMENLTGGAKVYADTAREMLLGVRKVHGFWEKAFPQKFAGKIPEEIFEEIDEWFQSSIDDLDSVIKSDPFGHFGDTDFLEKHS